MLRLSLVLVSLALAAGSKAAPFLTRFREDAGFVFSECKDVRCLRKAERTCRPAHHRRAQRTLEGAPTVTDFFVEPVPRPTPRSPKNPCHVAVFEDRTADVFSGCRILMRSCMTLADALGEGDAPRPCPEMEIFRDMPCGTTGVAPPAASPLEPTAPR